MPVKIKLQRKGTRNRPKFRIVIQEDREKLNGPVVDTLGVYEPARDIFELNKEKALEWLKKGAQPTEKMRYLLGKAGVMPPIDVSKLSKRKSKKEEAAEKAAKTAESTAKKEAKAEVKKEEPKKEAKPEAKKEEPKMEAPKKEEPKAEAKVEEKKVEAKQ